MSRGQQVGYIRVSTADQNTERQLDGYGLDEMFSDKASGKNADRPGLEAAMKHCRKGDELVVHSMDRLARNIVDLRNIIGELNAKDVRVRFVKENMVFSSDNSDPFATLMLNMLGSFAEFERSMILERQREGIAIAKANGKYKGRKPALSGARARELVSRMNAGETVTALAKEYGISRETAYQYRRNAGLPPTNS